MNAFDDGRDVERRSLAILRPFIEQRAFNGQYVVTAKGPLAPELQTSVGDVLYNSDAETIYSVEIKAEEENKHGNFFLETWSNRARFTVGWMFSLRCDLLLYHFIRQDQLFVIPFGRLRHWAFCERRIYKYPENKQRKYDQLNDTWGRCVPIATLQKQLNLRQPFAPAASDVSSEAAA